MSNGSLLAQSGANIGRMLGAGMSGLGGNIQGMLTGIGEGIGRRRLLEEAARREQGILGGSMAIRQAAQQGQLSPEMLRSWSGSMQGLGMSSEDIMKQVKELQKINAAAQKQSKTNTYIESLGPEYAALYEASGDFKTVYNQYLEDNKQDSIADLAQQLDPSLSDDLALNITSSDLMKLYESKKEEGGAKKWAKWVNENSEITDDNRGEAITVAVAAFGKDAPKKVADLEAKQLDIKAKKEGKKSVPVLITMKADAGFGGLDALGGGKTQITTKNLPVDANGNLSEDAKNWLEAHAATAMVQDTGETWETSKPSVTNNVVSGQGGEGTTLSQVAPGLVQSLVNTQMQD